jgi:hypothetical protein
MGYGISVPKHDAKIELFDNIKWMFAGKTTET